jgi:hypothetical protein
MNLRRSLQAELRSCVAGKFMNTLLRCMFAACNFRISHVYYMYSLLSAIFVGLIVDKNDLYASIVADSYAQSAQDEEFWKGLNEEEKIKAQELLRRIKKSKGQVVDEPLIPSASLNAVSTGNDGPVTQPLHTKSQTKEEKPALVDIFSDY